MKSRTLTYLLSKTTNKNAESTRNLDKNRIKVEIENACDTHLKDVNDIFQFEVNEKELDYVISIVESGLITKYDIFQDDRTIFNARLKEVELI